MLEEREVSFDSAAVNLTSPRAGAQTCIQRADGAVGGAGMAEATSRCVEGHQAPASVV